VPCAPPLAQQAAHPNESMPMEEDGGDDNEDVVVKGERPTYLCPITRKPFEAPVQKYMPHGCTHSYARSCVSERGWVSAACKHHYSREAIEQLIRQAGPAKAVKCPVHGVAPRLCSLSLSHKHTHHYYLISLSVSFSLFFARSCGRVTRS
jgi:SUMO ligase MMS21 Smc5/6 complex component